MYRILYINHGDRIIDYLFIITFWPSSAFLTESAIREVVTWKINGSIGISSGQCLLTEAKHDFSSEWHEELHTDGNGIDGEARKQLS